MSTRDDDVEEFAALLRRLKARTDRSYGALARRVNMNTSTLHRYCAGDAVPVDFAPVERFAALCGATPAERLELHRRWILAVAARQRPRTPIPPPDSPAPDTTEGSGPPDADPAAARTGAGDADDPRPRTPDGPGANGPDPGRSGEPVPGPADGLPPNGSGGSPPRATREPTSGTVGEPEPVDEVVAGAPAARPSGTSSAQTRPSPAPGLEPPPVGAPRAGAASGPRRRSARHRRRIGAGVVAVSALLATLGGLSVLSAGGSSDDASETVGPKPAPEPRPAPSGSGTRHHRSAGPSPGRTGPSASSGATGRASGSPNAGRRTAPPGRTEPKDGGSVAVPLTWTVNSQAWALGCGHDYVIRKDPAQVPPPPVPQDAGAWAATQGAVHGRDTNVEISVQGRTSTAVVLTALRVRVAGRTAPVPGTVYAMDQGCGGAVTPRSFAVDLDKDRPIARSVPGNDTGTPIPAVRMPYRVSAQDPEVLLVNARTETCGCSWYLELDWSSGGRTGTVRVDDSGRPFRTSGIRGLPRYWYASDGSDGSQRRWVPAG